jgi:hypothetical protein
MPLQRQYVNEQWNDFSKKVLSPECSDVQRIEMRRAFFAGAVALWSIFFKGLSEGEDVQPEDLKKMSDLQAEFDHYAEQLRKGAA